MMEARPHLPSTGLTLLALSLLIISFGLLMFEIALTRVFSLMLAYHYVFIAVSVALLGLGIGAVFFRFVRGRMPAEQSFSALCKLSLIFALSIPIATTLVLKIPYTDFLAVYYGITFIPFFFAGMIFALAFDRFTEHSSKLYCASLIGSGIGPIAVIFALESFGGVNTILLVGAISAIGAVAVALGLEKRKMVTPSLIGLLLLSALFTTNLGGDYIGEVRGESPDKELFVFLNDPQYDAKVTRTYWSAYARTDLVELGNDPSTKLIFNDGGAGTPMYQFDGENFDSVGFLRDRTEFFPFYFGAKNNVLIIGPGGGKEVLIALMNGAKNITAVEVNPDIVRIVREESGFNGGIYYHENVRWIVDEGRSFIKRSADNYDIIMFVDILTKSARELVGYSLTESYIFTVEAFEDSLDHLTEYGRLVMVSHQEIEATRIFVIGISALNRRGKTTSEATRQMILLERPTHPSWPVFILKKTPFSENESIEMYNKAQELGFKPLYFPYIYETQFEPLVTGQMSLEEWITRIEPYDLSPTTDDSPFFYNYNEKGLPSPLSSLFSGVLLLTLLFVIAAWLSLEYFAKYGRKTDDTKTVSQKIGSFNFVLFFLLLGLGFMLIEVAFVQKFILFLGQPTLAFSVLLFSLLVGGGIGSFLSDRFKGDLARKVILVSLFIGVLVTIYAAALPYVFDQFWGKM
jgi:hypothetical protein